MKSSAIGLKILQNNAGANGDGATYSLANCDHALVCITGTFNAKVHLEATIDGINWHEIAARDLTTSNTADKAKTITAPGLFAIESAGGSLLLRARISDWVSGNVTVKVNAHG